MQGIKQASEKEQAGLRPEMKTVFEEMSQEAYLEIQK